MATDVRARIIELLRTLRLARELWDGRSSGGGVRLMPSAYSTASYPELERVLATAAASTGASGLTSG